MRLRHGEVDPSTARIEAFSDGVFSITITLLIIEIKVPRLHDPGSTKTLAQAVLDLWPSYFAYLLSFVMIGIYWANHHYIFRLYKKTNHVFNLLNVFFLLCIAFLPFPTAVLGDYVTDPLNMQAAVILYGVGLFLPAFAWYMLWLYASGPAQLTDHRLDPKFVRFLRRQYLISNVVYGGALLVAFVSPQVSLCLSIGLTILYLLPPKKPEYLPEHSEAGTTASE